MSTLITKPLKIFLLLIALLGLTEIAYRNSLINFHSGIFNKLNPEEMFSPDSKRPVVLVLGDELSSNEEGYVNSLRAKFPGHLIINGAVPYSGPVEVSWIGSELIEKYNPDILIYQINPANDLYNIRKGHDLDEAGFFSAVTDMMSDEIKMIDYATGKLKSVFNDMSGMQLAMLEPEGVPVSQNFEFSANVSINREPQKGLIEYSSMLKSGRDHDLDEMLNILDGLFCKVKKECSILLTIVPHSTWVNGWYREQMIKKGNHISEEFMRFNGTLPFISEIKNKIFANRRVKIVDLTPSLKNIDCKENRLFNVASDQLNKKGHEVLATLLSGFIRYNY